VCRSQPRKRLQICPGIVGARLIHYGSGPRFMRRDRLWGVVSSRGATRTHGVVEQAAFVRGCRPRGWVVSWKLSWRSAYQQQEVGKADEGWGAGGRGNCEKSRQGMEAEMALFSMYRAPFTRATRSLQMASVLAGTQKSGQRANRVSFRSTADGGGQMTSAAAGPVGAWYQKPNTLSALRCRHPDSGVLASGTEA